MENNETVKEKSIINPCICCGKEANYCWFCPECTEIKEKAYAEAKRLGIKTWRGVISMRDEALSKSKNINS